MSRRAEAQVEMIRSLGRAEVLIVGPRRQASANVLRQWFVVGDHEVRLPLPVDWRQDPINSRSWRYSLHTLQWLSPVLARYAAEGDARYLAVARDVALDWTQQHLTAQGAAHRSEFAWYDMAVGLRAPHIAYVLRACLYERMIARDAAEQLLAAVERHAEELADDDNYAVGHNHGLFQDEGLYLLARQLPVLPQAADWGRLATARLRRTLHATVLFDEGAHLEHSSAYQFAMVNMVERLCRHVDELPELAELLSRLRRTAAWHVTPTDRIVQIGDTDDVPAPKWARERARGLAGCKGLFGAGQAFVREGESYLVLTSAYHGYGHKQADETGFVLMEGGRTILGDAGRWGYYEQEPDRLYARSSLAHNVLVVDGERFPWRDEEPYGSGLEAVGEGDGWYTIVARNQLLARQGVAHRRLLLYRPGAALIVIDDVRSDTEHDYERYFHFGPGLAAPQGGPCTAIADESDGRVVATFTEWSTDEPVALSRAVETERLGWWYPADRQRVPVVTLKTHARRATSTFAAVLTLGERSLAITAVTLERAAAVVALSNARAVHVAIHGRRGTVAERPARAE